MRDSSGILSRRGRASRERGLAAPIAPIAGLLLLGAFSVACEADSQDGGGGRHDDTGNEEVGGGDVSADAGDSGADTTADADAGGDTSDGSGDSGCEDAPDPGPTFCGDEQGRAPVHGEGGCITHWICLDPECDDPPIPDCLEGWELRTIEDSAGCVFYECVPLEPCAGEPEPDLVDCVEGHPVPWLDEWGCVDFWACAPDACESYEAPECEDGERVGYRPHENGCPRFSCVPAACEDMPDMEPVICDGAPGRVPVLDDLGCIVSWTCPGPLCECPAPPVCEGGREPIPVDNGHGCTCYACPTPFGCGEESCVMQNEYCLAVIPGVEGAETSYSCEAFPDECATSPDCACIEREAGGGASCQQAEDGSFRVTIAMP